MGERVRHGAILAAARLAFAEGRPRPRPDAIDVRELVGNVLAPTDDADIESEDEV